MNPDHPTGKHKTRVFEAALGFNLSNADDLLRQVREGVKNTDPIPGRVDEYGTRFTLYILVTGPKGTKYVETGWIYKPGSKLPALATILVK